MTSFFKKIKDDQKGNVTVEVGLVFIIITTLALGAFDYGRLIYEQHRLTQVARAGIQVGLMSQTDALDLDAIRAAAINAAGVEAQTMTFEVINYCRCPDISEGTGTTLGSVVDCTTDCADDTFPRMYMTLTATRELIFLFGLPGHGSQVISANASIRAR